MLRAVVIIFACFFLFNVIHAIFKKVEDSPPKSIMTFSEKRHQLMQIEILKQQVQNAEDKMNNQKTLDKDKK
jgi:hypothetical protein